MKLKIDEIYYKYCETLDLYSNAYLRNGMYSNIEDTTVEINRRYTNDMKKIQRIKK